MHRRHLWGVTETKQFAAGFARGRTRVLALIGDLGTGKTTFAKGYLRALGVRGRVVSPTFLIFRRYRLGARKRRSVYHFDLYRVRTPAELAVLGFRGILREPSNRIVIEWAEKARRLLPAGTRIVRFRHGVAANERIAEF